MTAPTSWFICPPPDPTGFRQNQLWGWRTNLRNALVRGNADRAREKIAAHDPAEVKEFCEMTLALTVAATTGFLNVCMVLVEDGGVAVDGIKDSNNKPEWVNFQRMAGNSSSAAGNTPLMFAAHKGHVSIVKYLLSKGANPSFGNDHDQYPLHCAVAGHHKDIVILLIKAGADVGQRDGHGATAMDIAEQYYAYENKKIYRSIVRLLELDSEGNPKALSRPATSCPACDEPHCRLSCSCGTVYYCDKQCQKSHWKVHKKAHNDALTARG